MSTEKYKSIVKRALEHFSQGNLDAYLELYSTNPALHYLPPGLPPGLEGARLFYGGFLAGFPDSQLSADDMIVDDNKVAVRYTLQATHQGEFMNIPPTNKRVTICGITILRFEGDKVVERWSEADFLGLMQQLGVIPAPEEA